MLIAVLITIAVAVVNCSWSPSGTKIFEDEFDGAELNETVWQVQEGHKKYGAKRLMCFQRENIKVQNGVLIITAAPQNIVCGEEELQYTSARIRTKNRFNYTAIEFVGRVSKGEHLQPGLWTQFSSTTLYEEIDVMEVKGTETGKYHGTGHWGKNYSHLVNKGHTVQVDSDLSKDYHTYGFEKTETELIYFFDGEEKAKTTRNASEWKTPGKTPDTDNAPFSEPANVLISLLVSGNWFLREPPLTQQIARKWEKATLEVDRVTVYG